MNLFETVQYLQETAAKYADTKSRLPGHPHETLVLHPAGDHEWLDDRPGDRYLQLHSIESLVSMVTAQESTIGMAVYIHPRQVRLMFNVDNGYEHATMSLMQTDEFAWLLARKDAPSVEMNGFCDYLRYVAGEDGAPPGLLEKVRRIDFSETTRTAAETQRTGESMGKTVTRAAQVVADDDQPGTMGMPSERQVFSPRLWKNGDLDYRAPLEVILDPDMKRQGWLVVVPDVALEAFMFSSLTWLAKEISAMLADTTVPVYLGTWEQSGN